MTPESSRKSDKVTRTLRHADYTDMAYDRISSGVLVLESDGTIASCNDAFADMTGMAKPEIVGGKISEFLDDGTKRRLPHHVPGQYECELRKRNRQALWVEIGEAGIPPHGHVVVTVVDVSARKSVEMSLALSEEKFSRIFLMSPDAIVVSRRDNGVIIEANPAFTAMFGHSRDEAVGRELDTLGFWASDEGRKAMATRLDARGDVNGLELRAKRKDGEVLTILVSARLFVLGGGSHCISIITDITERKEAEDLLRQYANMDTLTEANNRRAGLAILGSRIENCRRLKTPLSICFVDIDDLKKVNDAYGHREGDCLIRMLVAEMNSCLRASDVLCRFGGDEFLIILSGSDAENAKRVWVRIRQRLDTLSAEKKKPYAISASGGIVGYPMEGALSVDEFIALADDAMYREKLKHHAQNR